MKKRKPTRIKLLLLSCWVSSIISFIAFFALLIQWLGSGDLKNPFIITSYFLVFFVHGVVLLFLIWKFFPASEIPRLPIIAYLIFMVMAILNLSFLAFALIGFAFSDDKFSDLFVELRNPTSLVAFSLITLIVLSQIHMIFEGNRTIRSIRRKYRSELIESF